MKLHKHAELIKKWADGAKIEVRNPNWCGSTWVMCKDPRWIESFEYRVKNRHQALMDAYEKGAEIEFSTGGKSWTDVPFPAWHEDYEYRIKLQEPKVVTYSLTNDDTKSVSTFTALRGQKITITVGN
jgi:hypothetical protein